jgi:hypothetical protein
MHNIVSQQRSFTIHSHVCNEIITGRTMGAVLLLLVLLLLLLCRAGSTKQRRTVTLDTAHARHRHICNAVVYRPSSCALRCRHCFAGAAAAVVQGRLHKAEDRCNI